MPTFSQLPGDLTITLAVGDSVNFTLDLDVDVTGYTFSAGVYVVSINGFVGGGGGTVDAVGEIAITPLITTSNAAAGVVVWGVTPTQTLQLSPAIKYRHFVRWVTPAGLTRTIISGELIPKAP